MNPGTKRGTGPGTDPGTLALVESNTTGGGRELVRRARQEGLDPLLLCADPGRYAYVSEDEVPTRVVDTTSVPALRAALQDHQGPPLAGVTSTSEYYVETAARVARASGLAGPDPEAVARCRDKRRQRAALRAAGVPVPAYAAVAEPDQTPGLLRDLPPGPVVVKPAYGSGSVGVRLCRDRAEAVAHAATLLSAGRNERGVAQPRGVLVEEYVPGAEFSAEIVGGQVVGVTGKHLGPPPYFVETGHDFPAAAPDALLERIGSTALRALAALGLPDHTAHVEVRAGGAGHAAGHPAGQADEPTVIEVNPRLCGGGIPELVHLATGVDLIAGYLDGALGRPPRLAPTRSRAASLRFVTVPGDVRLHGVDGLAAARALPGVHRAEVTAGPEAVLRRRGDFRDRIGVLVATAADPATAAARADRALAALALRTTEEAA